MDGQGLAPSGEYPAGNRWLTADTSWISGADYIKAIKVRAACLQTPARAARWGASGNPNCSGCGSRATLGHIAQVCPRTHGLRVRRHDDIVRYLDRRLRSLGHTTFVEPRIPWGTSFYKPDLVVQGRGRNAIILDAQVVSDGVAMDYAHSLKVNKYGDEGFRQAVSRACGAPVRSVSSITLNWRGLWHGRSAKDLLGLGLSRRDLAVCSLKAATWTFNMFKWWKRSNG